jgi:PAS domain S-box-containing protein
MDKDSSSGLEETYIEMEGSLSERSEMGELIQKFDWSKTTLKPLSEWSDTLKATLNIALASPSPIMLLIGKEGYALYNDGLKKMAIKSHPALLGSRIEEVWPRAVDIIRNGLKKCMNGQSLTFKKFPFSILRSDYKEERYVDLHCNPVFNEDGKAEGVLIIVSDVTKRVKSEQKRRVAEDQLKRAVESSEIIGTWNYDLKSNQITADDKLISFFFGDKGVTKDSLDLSFYLNSIHTDDRERVKQSIILSINTGKPFSEVYRILNLSGRLSWISARGKCYYDKEGNPVSFPGVAIDITEQKQLEFELTKSKKNYQSIFNQSGVGIAQTDLNGKFILVNDHYCQILGRSKEELYKLHIQDVTYKDDLINNLSHLEQVVQFGKSFNIEKRYVRPDGSLVWVHINVSSVKDQNGYSMYILGVCHDITEKKHYEIELEASRKKSEREAFERNAILNQLSEGVIVTDSAGDIVFVNDAAKQLHGVKKLNIAPVNYSNSYNLLTLEGKPFPNNKLPLFRAVMNNETVINERWKIQRPDGTIVLAIGNARPVIGPNNEKIGAVLTLTDDTQRKASEDAILESEERFRTMAEASGILVAQTDVEGNAIYFNSEWLKLTGKSMEKLLNYGWADLLHPDDQVDFVNSFKKAFKEKVILKKEFRLLNKTGEYRWQLAVVSPRFLKGNFAGLVSSCIDITDLKATQEALKESEIRFRTMADASGLLIAHTSEDGKAIYFNKGWEDISGRSIENLLEDGGISSFHPEDAITFIERYQKAFINKESFKDEIRIWTKDNQYRWFLTIVSPRIRLNGTFAGYISSCIDITEQKIMQDVIKESEERFRNLADNAPAFIFLAGENANVEYLNSTWLNFTGMSFEEASGPGSLKATHPDDLELVTATYKDAFENHKPYSFEIRQRSANGDFRWVLWNGVPRFSADKFVGMMGIGIDITERKEAELRQKLFMAMCENSSEFIGIASTEGNTIYVNPAGREMVGINSLEEVYKTHVLDYFFEEDKEFVKDVILPTQWREGRWSGEFRFKNHKNGEVIPVLYNQFLVKDPDTEQVLAVATLSPNISEHKKYEEALKESEEKFRALADNISQFAWMADENGWIFWYNKRWYDYTGTTFEEMQGWEWKNVLHPDHKERVVKKLSFHFSNGKEWEDTFPLRSQEGQYRWFLSRAVPIKDEKGKVVRWFGTNTDITTHKLLTQQLEKKNRQLTIINNDLDNFIYTASHDLKAPLINIEGLVKALYKLMNPATKKNPLVPQITEMIQQSIDRFKETIKDLTEVAKVQSENEEDQAEISFKEILNEVKMIIKIDIDESKAIIREDFTEVPTIFFSKKNLRSILYNLISNAIKYRSPERQPVVEVKTTLPSPGRVLICVKDNGLGIKEDNKHKVFIMFKRLHNHVEGTGIGLAIVKRIIDQNGGKIDIVSEEGKGTEFQVCLRV